ncbi:ABC-F family ATP-binding cassette domain-containing protein [Candidatus Shapirobacteria bacterium]|nr:ABC-F family ATP-binding cassette domain-containing protein [Candidatus Shapirobacteria bacterium]
MISRGTVISVSGASLILGVKTIFNEIDFRVNSGEKVALVGPNGVGKTTIVRMVLREVWPDAGDFFVAKDLAIGYMPQALSDLQILQTESVLNFMLLGRSLDTLTREIESAYKTLASQEREEDGAALQRLGELQDNYERRDGYQAESQIKAILSGLDLPTEQLGGKLVVDLSGGQKTRLFLARTLFSNPDLLLLDEPTNHLDEQTIIWLSGYLEGFEGTILAVSHHQEFLDRVCTKTLYLNPLTHKAETYKGNYSFFIEEGRKRREKEEREFKKREREREAMWVFVNRWRGNASKRGVVNRKVRELKEMGKPGKARREKGIRVSFPVKEKGGELALLVRGVGKSYEGNEILSDLSFSLRRGERVAVLGPNGAGKTTLLKVIANDQLPDQGSIELGYQTSIGYFSQEHEDLETDLTPVEQLQKDYPGISYQKTRSVLGHFLLSEQAETSISRLSQGERSRLALARVMISGANLLVLDEPTNHLDAQSRKRLTEALLTYNGSMIIVSHDEELLTRLDIDRILVLPEKEWITGYTDGF